MSKQQPESEPEPEPESDTVQLVRPTSGRRRAAAIDQLYRVGQHLRVVVPVTVLVVLVYVAAIRLPGGETPEPSTPEGPTSVGVPTD